NPASLISARLLDRDPDAAIDRRFFAERLGHALALRDRLVGVPCYRLVHGEADRLPGAVIDRFGDALGLHLNRPGTAPQLPLLLEAIDEVLSPKAILLRNDSTARQHEGLASEVRPLRGAFEEPVELVENGVRFLADLREGQKTGWFYDQRDNRAMVAKF